MDVRTLFKVLTTIGVLALAGCASEMPSASPPVAMSPAQICDRADARWVATLGTCEVESKGVAK